MRATRTNSKSYSGIILLGSSSSKVSLSDHCRSLYSTIICPTLANTIAKTHGKFAASSQVIQTLPMALLHMEIR